MVTMLYDLPADYYDGFVDRLRGVTVREVNQAIRRRLDLSSLVVVTGTHDRIGAAVEAAIPKLRVIERVPYDLE